MTLDDLTDRELTDILKRNIKLDEFDTTLDKVGKCTVYVSKIRREIELALLSKRDARRHYERRNQEL